MPAMHYYATGMQGLTQAEIFKVVLMLLYFLILYFIWFRLPFLKSFDCLFGQ